MSSPTDAGPSPKAVLTGKYDMSILREISRIEDASLEELVELYGVEDEDELTIDWDIHQFIDTKEEERKAKLEELLKGCPKDTTAFIESFLEKIKGLNPKLL